MPFVLMYMCGLPGSGRSCHDVICNFWLKSTLTSFEPSTSSCLLENCNSFLCRTACFLCCTAEPRPNLGQRPSQWRTDWDAGHRRKVTNGRAIDICTIYYTAENLLTCVLFLHTNWEDDVVCPVLGLLWSGKTEDGSAGISALDGCVSGR